jgi:hypothetical protein
MGTLAPSTPPVKPSRPAALDWPHWTDRGRWETGPAADHPAEDDVPALLVELAARASCRRSMGTAVDDLVADELAGLVAELRAEGGAL